jgi:hypothetical protein
MMARINILYLKKKKKSIKKEAHETQEAKPTAAAVTVKPSWRSIWFIEAESRTCLGLSGRVQAIYVLADYAWLWSRKVLQWQQ